METTSNNWLPKKSLDKKIISNLSKKEQIQLNNMEVGRWYKDYELGNGKTLLSLCNKGLVEFLDKEQYHFIGHYKPWKYDKEFRRLS